MLRVHFIQSLSSLFDGLGRKTLQPSFVGIPTPRLPESPTSRRPHPSFWGGKYRLTKPPPPFPGRIKERRQES